MNIEEIRKGAPNGATHYYIYNEIITYIMYCGCAELSYINKRIGWAMMDYPDYDEPEIKPL